MLSFLQPPLPVGEDKDVEVGTEDWKRSWPVLKSGKARLVWIDMRQSGKAGGKGSKGTENEDGEAHGGGEELISKAQGEEEGWENCMILPIHVISVETSQIRELGGQSERNTLTTCFNRVAWNEEMALGFGVSRCRSGARRTRDSGLKRG